MKMNVMNFSQTVEFRDRKRGKIQINAENITCTFSENVLVEQWSKVTELRVQFSYLDQTNEQSQCMHLS